MFRKTIFTLFTILSAFVYSQKKQSIDRTIIPKIRVKTGVKKDQIALRWAVDQPLAWQKANKIGFRLKRYTLSRNGNLLSRAEEKDLGIFLPVGENEWKKEIEKNDNAAIVAQSLFGESFEVEIGGQQGELQGIINKSQELEQRFAYALMAADLDFKVAQMAGWGYVDKDVKSNEKYVYTVSLATINNPKIVALVEKGSALASIAEAENLPKPLDFMAIFKDKTVTLSWEYLQLRDTYTSYFVERSENKGAFKPLGDLPIMNMNDNGGKQAQGIVFVDSLAQNNTLYRYRIRGKTIFGDYGPYSNEVSGKGRKKLGVTPHILKFSIAEDESIKIDWDFPKEAEKEITSFQLLHSETDQRNSYKIVQDKIAVTQRSLVTKSIAPTNYYKIQAVGKVGDKRASFATLIQPNDTTPPITPLDFKGKIDSLGVVHLEWKANTEKDLEGYHIFRGIQKGDELVRITPQAITKNSYKDSIVLENLNSKVYYYITATDKRKNQSKASVILELEKPDKVRPQTPIFTKYTLENDGAITLHFLRSHSEDVKTHQLFRKDEESDNQQWKKIYETNTIKEDYTFTDKKVQDDKAYVYYLLAIDKHGLKSKPSQEITLRSHHFVPVSVINNLTSSINREKKQIELIWKIKDKGNISEIVVYRQKGDKKPTLWGTLNGAQNFLEDQQIKVGNTYTYLLKAMLNNNQVTKTEKITVQY